jgi:DNA-binding MarR family transcriptional regulator
MKSVSSARKRRRLTTAVKQALREMNNQLALLNRHVGAHLELRDVDLHCLDVIDLHGPLSPSALARHAGLHPATMTGILDRLQRGGWIVRERDAGVPDRRAVTVRVLRDRGAELFRLYSGMNAAMDEVCAGFSEAQLEVFAEFLRRSARAGRDATSKLARE